MNQAVQKNNSDRRVVLVGVYATPLAFILGTLGIFLATIPEKEQLICAGVLGFTVFYNVVFPFFFKNLSQDLRGINVNIRLYLNLAVNGVLVYFLGDSFRPIWLILALTPIASAIYGSRRNTLMKAAVVSALLVGIQAARPDRTWLAWGEQAAHISFIVLISLLVNRLASLISPQPATASI
ncbi:MAG TPA: hypothetical protein PKZ00_07735 [Elusimicrobiota bacterium]|jgi:hypothetical protein|nr:hypothetical protein [Elusimicrobiota bacterium]HND64269.1 hypothetical protein [Elusimicrobiota bacterium]HNI57457.1 hypothetical protein [Elusimicrobiota bacterium]